MKKMSNIFIAVLVFFAAGSLAAKKRSFRSFSKKILGINARPKAMHTDSTVLIIHPMIKQRKSRSVTTAVLTWSGKKCTIRITGMRHVSGRKMRLKRGSSRPIRHYYIPKKLRKLMRAAKISGWRYDSRIQIKKQFFPGYRFTATMDGVSRKGALCLQHGKLVAIELGFNKKGISHAKSMKESGWIWYFSRNTSGLILNRIFTVEAKKSRGVPFITTSDSRYSRF